MIPHERKRKVTVLMTSFLVILPGGCFTHVSVELEVGGLAINTMLEAQHITDIEGGGGLFAAFEGSSATLDKDMRDTDQVRERGEKERGRERKRGRRVEVEPETEKQRETERQTERQDRETWIE